MASVLRLLFQWTLCPLLILLGAGCSQEVNQDSPTEIYCGVATGQWQVEKITCDDQEVTTGIQVLKFNPGWTLSQAEGDSECQSLTSWETTFSSKDPGLLLQGVDRVRCFIDGMEVSSCSSATHSCNQNQSVSGKVQNFSACAISAEGMVLQRRVSTSTDSAARSACSDGQLETIHYHPGLIEPPRAQISITEGVDIEFAATGVGNSTVLLLNVENIGDAEATELSLSSLSAPFSFTGNTYPGTGGDCGNSLAAAESCQLEIAFSPVSSNTFSEPLTLSFNNGLSDSNLEINLTGIGFLASLTIQEAPSFTFTDTESGTTNTMLFTLQNNGTGTASNLATMALGGPFSLNGGTFPGLNGTCQNSLEAGVNCSIEVAFSPTTAGDYSDTLTVSYYDGTTSQQTPIDISGTSFAAGAAHLTLSEGPTFQFADTSVGSSSTHLLTLTNSGSANATSLAGSNLISPFSYTGGLFPGTGGTCPNNLNAGASCTVEIQFAPLIPNTYQTTLTFSFKSGGITYSSDLVLSGQGQ